MSVDDLELDRDGVTPSPPVAPPERNRTPWLIAAAVAIAVAAGALARWWTMPGPVEPPAAQTSPSAASAPGEPAITLPPLEEMDPYLRTLLGALTVRPELAAWLATDDLIHQMAWTMDRISRGASPASELKVLAPTAEFTTVRAGRVRRVDDASYRRYDGLAEAIASVDPDAVAKAYRTIRPRLNEAYRALGQSASNVDVALQQALDVLIATPIPEGPIEVVEGKGATWVFADPTLEALDPAQKHLLRMGPRNAKRVIETLRAVRQRLDS